jgi:hypothetical protein
MVVATLLSFTKFLRVNRAVTDAVSIEFLGAVGTIYIPPTLLLKQFPLRLQR